MMSQWVGETFADWNPKDVRRLIRAGELSGRSTSGICTGYAQANVIIVPMSLADDFEAFCSLNPGAFPVMYRSKPGELTAPPLAEESDIRTDGVYSVCQNGKLLPEPCTLLPYRDQLKDMVTFYTGCSFSFEGALLTAGVPLRNLEQRMAVNVFKTNIRCHPFNSFDCELVVTMRYVPADKVETAFRVTHSAPTSHGAPIHVGEPAVIGITDVDNVDWGDVVEATPGDVPMFWPCGITMEPAVMSAAPPIGFFTHGTTGCLFLCDTKTDFVKGTNMADTPSLVQISQNPLLYSVASEKVVGCVNELERCILPPNLTSQSNEFFSDLPDKSELLKSSLALSHASTVAIVILPQPQREDYSGLQGAAAITAMLQALGKHVTMVTNKTNENLVESFVRELVRAGYLQQAVPVLSYPNDDDIPNDNKSAAIHFLTQDDGQKKLKFDHLVRIGGAKGATEPISGAREDQLFDAGLPWLKTTGIGVRSSDEVSTDYTIRTGVSSWGGWALATALFMLNACPIHDRYQRKSVGLARDMKDGVKAAISIERELQALSVVLEQANSSGRGDELQLSTEQKGVITAMRNIAGLN